MFRKERIRINGVALPEEFIGANILNTLAISPDGSRYAYVSPERDLIVGDVPEDGKLEFDGMTVTYQNGRIVHSDMSGRDTRVSIGPGTVVAGNINVGRIISGKSFAGDVSIQMGSPSNDDINESYSDISGVSVNQSNSDLKLDLDDSITATVKGEVSEKPYVVGGILIVNELDGKLILPSHKTNLELVVNSVNGRVRGNVAHPGSIRTVNGRISLDLYAPLAVRTSTVNSRVTVNDMTNGGRGEYLPPGVDPVGVLDLQTVNGRIRVDYRMS